VCVGRERVCLFVCEYVYGYPSQGLWARKAEPALCVSECVSV
jgi:hypothetical protein